MVRKKQKKTEKYQELKREIKHLWSVRNIEVVPVGIGAVGIVRKEFELWIKKIGITVKVEQVQKTTTRLTKYSERQRALNKLTGFAIPIEKSHLTHSSKVL